MLYLFIPLPYLYWGIIWSLKYNIHPYSNILLMSLSNWILISSVGGHFWGWFGTTLRSLIHQKYFLILEKFSGGTCSNHQWDHALFKRYQFSFFAIRRHNVSRKSWNPFTSRRKHCKPVNYRKGSSWIFMEEMDKAVWDDIVCVGKGIKMKFLHTCFYAYLFSHQYLFCFYL